MRVIIYADIEGDIEEDTMSPDEKKQLVKTILEDGAEAVCMYARVHNITIEEEYE